MNHPSDRPGPHPSDRPRRSAASRRPDVAGPSDVSDPSDVSRPSGLSGLTGPAYEPGDAGYEAEVAPLNRAVVQRPALVVGAACAEDVAAAVRYAVGTGRAVSVMATGHGPSVAASGHVLITTRRMDAVRVDPEARICVVGAGARWRDVLARTTPHGLAPLNGSSPAVGAVGYTLGGGVGLLGRRFGYAADHVRSLDVVTADGRTRHVTAADDPDLFWALRGGKGNFGVVVAMETDLFPVARFYGGGLYFDASHGPEALRTYVEWTRKVPEEMSSSVLLIRYPDHPSSPAPLRGHFVTHVRVAHTGPRDEGERLVAPLRGVGPRLLDTVAETPYSAIGTVHHEPTEEPYSAFDRATTLGPLDRAGAEALLSLAGPSAGAPYIVELRHHGGAYGRVPRVPSAVGAREAEFTLYSGTGPGEEERAAQLALFEKMRPWGAGAAFLNFSGPDQSAPGIVATAYAPGDHARLVRLKQRYDPGNVFRVNHNIRPGGPG
ncbi:FAD-binding oxidoreductase [Streptomyces iconiensis]|uniref:FAD-binding oxidoreductase n=1 Tax=Streptomyces iconiensis TaxID=1384038 RepID=A0ABT6ZT98_9ACTN|nr:FAD-binding oxidoreductase [Streptomyces iconiensis]MDJ1132276.1 FAD-binding oxidoreductase [Streptomyces iconiensis]